MGLGWIELWFNCILSYRQYRFVALESFSPQVWAQQGGVGIAHFSLATSNGNTPEENKVHLKLFNTRSPKGGCCNPPVIFPRQLFLATPKDYI